MSDRILVINPNSTEAVTQGIDTAMEPLRMPGGPAIECVTLKEGPPGIENQAHVEQVVGPIGDMVKKRDNDCSAFVIACYSDPGLHAAREITTKPVLGIAECGILTALTLGQRFGVISILRKSIPRHLRYVGQMGLNDRMAGDRAIGLGVVELSNEATHLRPHGRGRRRTARRGRRRRAGHGLRRHGALSRPPAAPCRPAGGRAQPGGGVDGDRPVAAGLVGLTALAIR